MKVNNDINSISSISFFSDHKPVPELLTEDEVIQFLRIPEVSTAKNHHNVILNLIRLRNLPRIHIGKKLLFPRQAILEWIESETIKN